VCMRVYESRDRGGMGDRARRKRLLNILSLLSFLYPEHFERIVAIHSLSDGSHGVGSDAVTGHVEIGEYCVIPEAVSHGHRALVTETIPSDVRSLQPSVALQDLVKIGFNSKIYLL